MSNFDKYLLLASLSFFFASMAVALVGLNFDLGAPASSYMYSPAAIEPEQSSPIGEASRQYTRNLPQSVLHYPLDTDTGTRNTNTVNCYLEAEYKKLLTERTAALGATLAAQGEIGGDRMELYITGDDRFFVFVIGPDAIGQTEACEVASGTGWQLSVPENPPPP